MTMGLLIAIGKWGVRQLRMLGTLMLPCHQLTWKLAGGRFERKMVQTRTPERQVPRYLVGGNRGSNQIAVTSAAGTRGIAPRSGQDAEVSTLDCGIDAAP